MLIIYSSTRVTGVETPEGTRFLNPSYFSGPVEGVTSVFIRGDYPKIRKAYERLGVLVHDLDRTKPGEMLPPPVEGTPELPALTDLSEAEQAEVEAILNDAEPFDHPETDDTED